MAAPGVTLVNSFTYRGAPEEWSNTYHFQGSAPSTPADWRSLVDALVAKVKLILEPAVTIERALCYSDTSSSSVYSYDLAAFAGVVAGTFDLAANGAHAQEGDTCYELRWGTGRTTSKGKPIYLRKYYHPALTTLTGQDVIAPGLQTATDTFASSIMSSSGAWPGLAGPDGVAPTGYRTMPFVSTRQLRKGRKRPT